MDEKVMWPNEQTDVSNYPTSPISVTKTANAEVTEFGFQWLCFSMKTIPKPAFGIEVKFDEKYMAYARVDLSYFSFRINFPQPSFLSGVYNALVMTNFPKKIREWLIK